MYRKKNNYVSFRLKSYLLIHTNASFRLSAYLKNISCKLTLPSGLDVPMNVEYSIDPEMKYELDTMVHLFWASGELKIDKMRNSVGMLRIDYQISFSNHPSEESSFFEKPVPIIVKTWTYNGA